MIRYAALLGKWVEAVYRFGTVYVLVVGTLLAVHLKIPYHCIVRLNESSSTAS